MKYHVTFYYLASGMEGHADRRDYGVVEAKSEKDAKCKAIGAQWPDADDATKSFVLSCLTAKPVTDRTGIGRCQDQGCPAHYATEDCMRDKFEQLVRDTCHVDEYTFKRDGGAYFRTTYAKTYDGLPPREMASVQTLWAFYQAGARAARSEQK